MEAVVNCLSNKLILRVKKHHFSQYNLTLQDVFDILPNNFDLTMLILFKYFFMKITK